MIWGQITKVLFIVLMNHDTLDVLKAGNWVVTLSYVIINTLKLESFNCMIVKES